MKNKIWSLIVIVGIYIFAGTVAVIPTIFLFDHIENIILLLFIADCIATAVVFTFSLILKNASVYDPYWSVAPIAIIIGYYFATGAKFSYLHLIVLIPLLFWSIRLTFNWAKGFSDLKWQDWRYTDFKEKNPVMFPLISFFGIMFMPTCLVFTALIPFYYLIIAKANLAAIIIGGIVILAAAVYQTIADAQKHTFAKNPENKGQCIDAGLWALSRHPNYFGEIMIWWGVFFSCLGNFHWLTILGAVAITLLFFFISIPMMEKHLLKTRPQFSQYKKSVISSIIPFRKLKR